MRDNVSNSCCQGKVHLTFFFFYVARGIQGRIKLSNINNPFILIWNDNTYSSFENISKGRLNF